MAYQEDPGNTEEAARHHHEHRPEGDRDAERRDRSLGRRRGDDGGHRFERGDLRYVLLERLAERPDHGYELIRALEERFHGFYTPSPGVVYPTLQSLEELGYVTVVEQDGRKTFTITDAGRSFLEAGRGRLAEIEARARERLGPFDHQPYRVEIEGIHQEMDEIVRALRATRRHTTLEQLRRVHEVARQARQQVEQILQEAGEQPREETAGAAA